MAFHRSQARFRGAKWGAPTLIVSWILQLLLALAIIGLTSWRLDDTIKQTQNKTIYGKTAATKFAWEGTCIAISLTAIISVITEVWKYAAETLTPNLMLFSYAGKLVCAVAILGFDVSAYVILKERRYLLVNLGVDALFLLIVASMTVNSVFAHRRSTAYDYHARGINVMPFGFTEQASGPQELIDKRKSAVSFRSSLSASSEPDPLLPMNRSPSQYEHKRSTEFEEYMARRVSGQFHSDDNQSLGARSSFLSLPTGLTHDSMVNPRTIQAQQTRIVMPRTTSWASDHVLISPPEEELNVHRNRFDHVSLLTEVNRKDITTVSRLHRTTLDGRSHDR